MLIIYSKKTGKIKNIVVNPQIQSIRELYPHNYEDYEDIYECITLTEDLFIVNNQDMFRVKDGKINLDTNDLDKYKA